MTTFTESFGFFFVVMVVCFFFFLLLQRRKYDYFPYKGAFSAINAYYIVHYVPNKIVLTLVSLCVFFCLHLSFSFCLLIIIPTIMRLMILKHKFDVTVFAIYQFYFFCMWNYFFAIWHIRLCKFKVNMLIWCIFILWCQNSCSNSEFLYHFTLLSFLFS